jgi:uncharacterized protein YceK
MKGIKGIFVLIVLFCIVLMLGGCASIMGKTAGEAIKADAAIAKFMNDQTLSTNCRAGIADAALLAPDSNASVRAAAGGVSTFADKGSKDYKDCYSKMAWIEFMIHGSIDLSDKVLSQLITFGLVK